MEMNRPNKAKPIQTAPETAQSRKDNDLLSKQF
jgi:hypothetical protein